MRRQAILAILLLTFLSISPTNQSCQNGGLHILARKKQSPHLIGYFCLCPFNYYGDSCQMSRDLLCQFSNEKVVDYDPKISGIAELEFVMECYLMKLDGNLTGNSKELGNFYRLPMSQKDIRQQLESKNYYIDKQYQIIWANDSSLFQNNGALIRQPNQTRTDQQILNSYPRYQFPYNLTFQGVPLYGSSVSYTLNAVLFRKSSISMPEPEIKFREMPQIGERVRYVGSFRVEIGEEMQEYRVARPELLITMVEGSSGGNLTKKMGMNSAKWRVYDPAFPKGTTLQPNIGKIPSTFWVILAFLGIITLIWGGRLAIKFFKKWRSRKQMKQLQRQDDGDAKDDEEGLKQI